MSLRSKVVGTLLGVFVLYVLAAWLVLAFIHTPAFNSLENSNASDQLLRVQEFIEAERADVDLLVTDWSEWDDLMLFARGENDEFQDENLAEGYLRDLGMSFGIIVDMEGQPIWSQAYPTGEEITSIDYLFPSGIDQDSGLLSPVEFDEHVSGLVATAQGPAIVSSAAILWSNAEGPPGGHMIAGKLLDASRLETISQTVLSTIDLLPVESKDIPQEFREAFNKLDTGEQSQAMVKQGDQLYSLKILNDIEERKLALLRVSSQANISILGTQTLRTTITMLIVAALVLTLTLWMVLKGMLLLPIEHLTTVLRGVDGEQTGDGREEYLHSTMRRLTNSRGSISQRNDEIGELISAFDDLSSSLQDATTSVWRIAHLDGLTGLANRRLIMERLNRAITSSQGKQEVAVLFIDLDDFKIVNDRLGHEAGDQLLMEVASRLRYATGTDDCTVGPEDEIVDNMVARIGGDEFVVLLTSAEHPEYATEIAEKIVQSVATPYYINDTECLIGACVGVAVFPEDANDLNGILANADTAMYEAKRAGKNTWRRYRPDMSRIPLRKSA
ncbi:MAG: diguanylate cyclase [Granulosicoccus sp.]